MMIMKIKKEKCAKNCFIKGKLKIEDYKTCLGAIWRGNEISYLENNTVHADSLKEDDNDFIKNNRLILKSQKRFESINTMYSAKNVALSANNEKRTQPIDSIKIYLYIEQINW